MAAGQRSRAIVLALVGMLCAAALAGCAASGDGIAPTRSTTPTWHRVDLPDGEAPVTLTAYPGGVLVGTQNRANAAPGLLRLAPPGTSVTRVSVRPASPYAAQGTWLSIAAEDDGRLVAVAGARGGAHSNVRWSVWRGDVAAGLAEQEQPFSTFGGWGAGEQLGVLTPDTGPLLLGSWESRGAGLDADIWLPEGPRWVRQDPTGSALASTTTELVGPRSGAASGATAVVVGSLVTLTDGVRQQPALWQSTSGNTGWSRRTLPTTGRTGEAVAVGCHESSPGCLVVGVVDGRLAAWAVAGGSAPAEQHGIPVVDVSDRAPLPAPMWRGGTWTVLAPSGSATHLLRLTSGSWEQRAGPPGVVTAAATNASGTMYAVTTDSTGVATLWATDALR